MDVESLIRTLRAYGASVDATAVRAALDSEHDTALRDWVSLHVAPDTLLSVDELNQYSALEKAGVAEKLLTASADMAAVQPFAEHEIRNAIVELKRSTEAISKQTEALKQQHEAVNRLVNGRRKEVETRASLEASHWQTWDAKRRDLLQVVEELSQGLDSRIAELEQRGYGGVADVKQTADALFHSDDKLLSSLQKLGWELETEDPEEQDNVVTLRETCARLIKFTVETVRTKLDRIYLESLDSSMRSGATRRVSADDVSALQEELESLYAEILPVAQMSVEQQFLEPALKNLAARRGQGLAKSEEAVTYMDDCLDYLMDHTGELSRRVEAFQAYQTAAAAVVDVAKAELASTVDLPTKKERRPTVTASPTRRRKSSGHGNAVSPVRARAQPGRRRSSGAGAIGDEPPLEELLRTLAITAPQDESEAADIEAQVRLLASTLAERRGKAEDVGRNVQQSFESAASSQIADAKLAVQLVRDSILAESPFGEVRLVDPEIEGSLAVLAQELENVNGKLEGVNAGLVKIKGKSAKRDEIISRWGS
ncbi:hypothetical protein QBC34DRAFT_498362 [Podospora aff. communis PSN243]|uniref:HAUS augmin-like complex subunit 3 N-terminal domain-containing protein n=1 Tax=Podospora aff. communis PSN243 TaxID=3040156 RepID=A0AAV9G8A9_9PEZI|nr:hypothetical protein QBC34DRAFT_498362 [Podospora aff. communis PSN243]